MESENKIRLWTFAPGFEKNPTVKDSITKLKELIYSDIVELRQKETLDLVWGPEIQLYMTPISTGNLKWNTTNPCGEIPLNKNEIDNPNHPNNWYGLIMPPAKVSEKIECICGSKDLFNFGCRCGFLKE